MRPLTERQPKALIRVLGTPLIDRILDNLAAAGVAEAVVNLHHLGARLRTHLAGRAAPRIRFSEEETLLETGGGVTKALPLLGENPFYAINGDVLWLDGSIPALIRLADSWAPERMDALLLLHPIVTAYGYDGPGDFAMDPQGRLSYRRQAAPFVFAGLQILSPKVFAGRQAEPCKLLDIYLDLAQAGRLYGERHRGAWFHVGTPADLKTTESILTGMGLTGMNSAGMNLTGMGLGAKETGLAT